jgi:cytochrome P450
MTLTAPSAVGLGLFDDPVLAHPYDAYQAIRDTGPAVYLPAYDVWAVARHADVRHALRQHLLFSSAQGVGLLDVFNAPLEGSVQTTDPPGHRPLRRILAARLSPDALGGLEATIVERAEDLVARLVARGAFDAVTDLASPFALATMGDLIGLPPETRGDLLVCAEASFQAAGPMNAYTQRSLLDLEAVFTFLTTEMARNRLRPDGMAATVYEAADQGAIDPGSITNLLRAFALPSIHTTANGLGSMLWLLATNPDAWRALRANPSLVGSAVEESLRLETPIQMFCRVTTRDVEIDHTVVPEGHRVLLLLGAANRDPRRWPSPDHFDIHRNPTDHLGFGYGIHACIGHTLAKMHLRAILTALVKRTPHLYLNGSPCRQLNNTARGFASVPLGVW